MDAETAARESLFFTETRFGRELPDLCLANYLGFLALSSDESHLAARRLASLLAKWPSSEVELDIIKLLTAVNWRFHLVACIALSAGFRSTKTIERLWKRIVEGSWVAPQLVATAASVDAYFDEKARRAIEDDADLSKSTYALAKMMTLRGHRIVVSHRLPDINGTAFHGRETAVAIVVDWKRQLKIALPLPPPFDGCPR